jgi:death-on-curing protein
MVSPRFLTLSEVLLILEDQIRRYGGDFGVRDLSLLSSALAMPEAQFSGAYLHETIFDQAAAYAFHICQNHPFVDGNKRVGLASALVFLDLNGYEINDPDEELYDLMMSVAAGRTRKAEIAAAFRRFSRSREAG